MREKAVISEDAFLSKMLKVLEKVDKVQKDLIRRIDKEWNYLDKSITKKSHWILNFLRKMGLYIQQQEKYRKDLKSNRFEKSIKKCLGMKLWTRFPPGLLFYLGFGPQLSCWANPFPSNLECRGIHTSWRESHEKWVLFQIQNHPLEPVLPENSCFSWVFRCGREFWQSNSWFYIQLQPF